jgi:hypothetical protein
MSVLPGRVGRSVTMQIEADQSVCPACGAARLEFFPVLHHMMCAYVGPEYDFFLAADGYTCPKCRRAIVSNDHACEIVGTSARCSLCSQEMVVSPPRPAYQPIDAEIPSNLQVGTAPVLAAVAPRARREPRGRIGIHIDHTLKEVGRRFSVTGAHIRQIAAKLKHLSLGFMSKE